MSKTDKYLVLACDPDEGVWSLVYQGTDADAALETVEHDDPSLRIIVNTANFINFPIGPKEPDNG